MPRVMPMTDQSGHHSGWLVHCPGCGYGHLFDGRWTYNGDAERPTFRASMLVNGSFADDYRRQHGVIRCHSFVTDGRIQFLADCDHALKGQTVDMPDVDAW